MSSEPQEEECIGTVQIHIHDANAYDDVDDDDNDMIDGMAGFAALYRDCDNVSGDGDDIPTTTNYPPNSGNHDVGTSHHNSSPLTLWVTDGRRSFQTRIDLRQVQVRMKKEHLKEMGHSTVMDWVISAILRQKIQWNSSSGDEVGGNENGEGTSRKGKANKSFHHHDNDGGIITQEESQLQSSQSQTETQTQTQSSQLSLFSSSQPLLLPNMNMNMDSDFYKASAGGAFADKSSSSVEFTMRRTASDSFITKTAKKNNHGQPLPREIEMIIKHHAAKGNIVRVVSKQILQQVITTDTNTTSQHQHHHQHHHSLPFIEKISSALHQTQHQMITLKKQHRRACRNLTSWKKTAEKLHEQHWNVERDEMMGRFLTLLNRVKGDLRSVQSQLSQEKHASASLQRKVYALQDKLMTTRRQPRALTMVVDHVDEHDCETFDDDEVDLLARGDRLNPKKEMKKDEVRTSTSTGARARTVSSSEQKKTGETTAALPLVKGRAAARLEERKRKRLQQQQQYQDQDQGGGDHDGNDNFPLHKKRNKTQDTTSSSSLTMKSASTKTTSSAAAVTVGSSIGKEGSKKEKNNGDEKMPPALSQSSQSSMRRRNQYTGTMELWGAQAIFSDDDVSTTDDE